MSYEQKDNSGSMWPNEKKEKDSHPDRTGSIMVDGKEYWINGWLKKTQEGKPWLSLSVKPKEKGNSRPAAPRQQPARAPAASRPASGFDDMDDDIPW